jgi:hypothetical protein
MMLPTGQCLAVFGREMSGHSSPVAHFISLDPRDPLPTIEGVAKLTSDDMKASCDESADMYATSEDK